MYMNSEQWCSSESLLKEFNSWENMFPEAPYCRLMWWGLLLKPSDNDVTTLSIQCYFLGVPEHWCKTTEGVFSNCTEDQVRALTIPIEYRDGQSVYSQCQIFKYNYTEQEIDGYCSGNSSSPKDMYPLASVGCSQWDFDTSVYSHNIVTEVFQWHSFHKYFICSLNHFVSNVSKHINFTIVLNPVFLSCH